MVHFIDKNIEIRELEQIKVRSLRKKIQPTSHNYKIMLQSLFEDIKDAGTLPSGPPIILYYDIEPNPKEMDVEIAWPVTEEIKANRIIPAAKAASYTHIGSYQDVEKIYTEILKWVKDKGFTPLPPLRRISHNNPNIAPEDGLVIELMVPFKEEHTSAK